MKKDWSLFRITVLLYIIVAMIPLNYYFAHRSFESIQVDSMTMQRLVLLNGAIQQAPGLTNESDIKNAVQEIDSLLDTIDRTCIQLPGNGEYIELFRAQESFNSVIKEWNALKAVLPDPDSVPALSERSMKAVNAFSEVTKDMYEYKSDNMLDILYFSLVVTMLFIVALIFAIRFYIHLQIRKHAIHDHITGLYNKKYFREALQKAKLFSVRHDMPLSIIALSFENYDRLKQELGKKAFETLLYDFANILKHFFRHSDTISRIEPNTFVIIVEAASVDLMQQILERLDKELLHADISSKSAVYVKQGYAGYDKESDHSVLDEAKERMSVNSPVCLGDRHES